MRLAPPMLEELDVRSELFYSLMWPERLCPVSRKRQAERTGRGILVIVPYYQVFLYICAFQSVKGWESLCGPVKLSDFKLFGRLCNIPGKSERVVLLVEEYGAVLFGEMYIKISEIMQQSRCLQTSPVVRGLTHKNRLYRVWHLRRRKFQMAPP